MRSSGADGERQRGTPTLRGWARVLRDRNIYTAIGVLLLSVALSFAYMFIAESDLGNPIMRFYWGGRPEFTAVGEVPDDLLATTGFRGVFIGAGALVYATADGRQTARSDGRGRFEVTGRAIVAMDSIGAGADQLVLIAQGSSARLAQGLNKVPVDAVVVGIVDEAVVMGAKVQ